MWTTTTEGAVGCYLVGAAVASIFLPRQRERASVEPDAAVACGELALFLAASFGLAAFWTLSRWGSLGGGFVWAAFCAIGPARALVRRDAGPRRRAAVIDVVAGCYLAASAVGKAPGLNTTGRLLAAAVIAAIAAWQLLAPERSAFPGASLASDA